MLLAIVVYGVPIVSTGDPLWPLPTETKAQTLVVYWDGARTEVARGAAPYDALMSSVNGALSSPQGIEYRYGLTADAFAGARATGRALEALYPSPQRAHGAYALGEFTRLFVFLKGDEYDRGLIFVGDQSGYRSGPMRARDLSVLRDLASSARTQAARPSAGARGYHLPA